MPQDKEHGLSQMLYLDGVGPPTGGSALVDYAVTVYTSDIK